MKFLKLLSFVAALAVALDVEGAVQDPDRYANLDVCQNEQRRCAPSGGRIESCTLQSTSPIATYNWVAFKTCPPLTHCTLSYDGMDAYCRKTLEPSADDKAIDLGEPSAQGVASTPVEARQYSKQCEQGQTKCDTNRYTVQECDVDGTWTIRFKCLSPGYCFVDSKGEAYCEGGGIRPPRMKRQNVACSRSCTSEWLQCSKSDVKRNCKEICKRNECLYFCPFCHLAPDQEYLTEGDHLVAKGAILTCPRECNHIFSQCWTTENHNEEFCKGKECRDPDCANYCGRCGRKGKRNEPSTLPSTDEPDSMGVETTAPLDNDNIQTAERPDFCPKGCVQYLNTCKERGRSKEDCVARVCQSMCLRLCGFCEAKRAPPHSQIEKERD